MAGTPAVQLTIHHGAADLQAMNVCLHVFGVTDMTDTLARVLRASCTARVVGKTTDEVDKLAACQHATGALADRIADEESLLPTTRSVILTTRAARRGLRQSSRTCASAARRGRVVAPGR